MLPSSPRPTTASLRFHLLILIATSTLPLPSPAVITAGNHTDNVIAPSNGAPWNYVGQVTGGASAIYLGNSWALTAFHSGPGPLTLGSTTYSYTGISHRLTTLSPNDADMILFKINGDPGLAPILINNTSPPTGTQVTLIGYGKDQGPFTQWDAGWNTIPPSTNPMVYQGYQWLPTNAKAWGLGNINTYFSTPVDAGSGPNWSFNTTFLFMEDYAQGSPGDSGGGVFYYNGSLWELTGMMFATNNYSGQPGNTSVTGNQTFHATLAAYKNEILAVTAIPEPTTPLLITLGLTLLLTITTKLKRARHSPSPM
jgi:hypothetical protein